MSKAEVRRWSLDAFLAWEAGQERRFELVDGEAVLMAGGSQAHALLAANLLTLLRPRLRGGPCRPLGSDLRVPIPATGNARYPDVTIDCGPYRPDGLDASEPAVVFEILSRSTGWYDQTRKLRDYESLASVKQYVCVSQSELRVSVWLRARDGRLVAEDDRTAPDAALPIVGLDTPLLLRDLYEDTGLLPPATAG